LFLQVLQELLNLTLNEMLDLVEVTLHDDPYSISEAASLLEISDKEFTDLFLSDATQDLQSFQSKKRLRYIFNESARVSAFHAICMENGSSEKQGVLAALGDLMYESHASGRYEYQCSCEDLDELVRVMMDNGAYGARLTGAGWGGCAVALIDKGKVEEFVRNVKDDFFTKNSKRLERLNDSIFVTSPGDGAQIYSKEVSVLQSSA
jgi:galactokinase